MDSDKKRTVEDSSFEVGEGFYGGQIVNQKYIVEYQLGQGAMGLTYLAYDVENINRKVVLKTIFKRSSTAAVDLAFLKEGEALGRINHDGVVKLFDKGTDAETGLPFLVMEFVKGVPLSEFLKRGQMSVETAVSLTEQMAFALNAAHLETILHRDFKPANIMVIESEVEKIKIKLIDFGVAKVANSVVGGDTTQFGSFKGTLQYASPEQLAGRQTIEGETYSLALVCYEMLTGRRPFPITVKRDAFENDLTFYGRVFAQLREMQSAGPENPQKHNPLISDETARIVEKGLQSELADRFKTPIEFAAALKKTIKEKPGKSAEANREPVKRQRFWPTAALIFLLAGILGFGVWYAANRPPPPAANSNNRPAADQTAAAVFSFSFEVQRMKNNMVDGDSFKTADRAKINEGDKVNLLIEREKAGHFYLLEQTGETLNIAFSTADGAGKKNVTQWTVAKRDRIFWLVCSPDAIELFENKPLNESASLKFLETNRKNIEEKTGLNKTEVKSSDKTVIYKLSF